ncbi:MAG: AAA family ATPase [Bauldia sp.]|nr:AAA family ATPase [Bauldia sp.]
MSSLAFDSVPAPVEEAVPAPDSATIRPVPRISIQAFCEGHELAETMEAAAADRRMARAHVKVHMGGIAAATEFYSAAPTPNLILVESRHSGEKLLGELERLAAVCDVGSKVVVVGQTNDVELYRELSRRGVSEYLVNPVGVLHIIRAIVDLYTDPAADPLGRTIAFVGGKGGVGSSTVSHSVAFAIARNFENDVVLADLDLAFGTAGLDFNQDPAQGIAEAIHAPERLDDIFLDRLLARCTDHLSLLAAPATLDRTLDLGETTFEPVIDIARNSVPSLILDLPHLWTGWVRRTLIAADEIVLTVEPDLANLRNAKNLLDLLRQARQHDSPPKLVINKVGMPKRPEIKAEEFAKALEMEPTAIIPFEAHLFGTAANNGQVIAEVDPKSAVTEHFHKIAQSVSGKAEPRRSKRPALSSVLSRLRGKKT